MDQQSIIKAMTKALQVQKFPAVVHLERLADYERWSQAITKVAEIALGPTWRSTIKAGGQLFRELADAAPEHPAVKKINAEVFARAHPSTKRKNTRSPSPSHPWAKISLGFGWWGRGGGWV